MFEIRPYLIFFLLSGILKLTKKTLSLVSALSSLSVQYWGNKFYLFHLFGIHVLSELSFHTNPLFSFRMHIDSEISLFACSGYKWFFLINKSLIYSFHVWIIKFTEKTLSLVSATSDSFMPLSAHGVINSICFTCSGYMCYRN